VPVPVRLLLESKALVNKGRMEGMQAATMTTFCSTLGIGGVRGCR
jgi:hypothetical protein